eukprot:10992-Heterococcus_DN1.PRE.4
MMLHNCAQAQKAAAAHRSSPVSQKLQLHVCEGQYCHNITSTTSLRQAPVRLNDALATSDNNVKLVLPSRFVKRHPEPLHLCECIYGSHIEHQLKQMTTDSVLNPDGVLLVDSDLGVAIVCTVSG